MTSGGDGWLSGAIDGIGEVGSDVTSSLLTGIGNMIQSAVQQLYDGWADAFADIIGVILKFIIIPPQPYTAARYIDNLNPHDGGLGGGPPVASGASYGCGAENPGEYGVWWEPMYCLNDTFTDVALALFGMVVIFWMIAVGIGWIDLSRVSEEFWTLVLTFVFVAANEEILGLGWAAVAGISEAIIEAPITGTESSGAAALADTFAQSLLFGAVAGVGSLIGGIVATGGAGAPAVVSAAVILILLFVLVILLVLTFALIMFFIQLIAMIGYGIFPLLALLIGVGEMFDVVSGKSKKISGFFIPAMYCPLIFAIVFKVGEAFLVVPDGPMTTISENLGAGDFPGGAEVIGSFMMLIMGPTIGLGALAIGTWVGLKQFKAGKMAVGAATGAIMAAGGGALVAAGGAGAGSLLKGYAKSGSAKGALSQAAYDDQKSDDGILGGGGPGEYQDEYDEDEDEELGSGYADEDDTDYSDFGEDEEFEEELDEGSSGLWDDLKETASPSSFKEAGEDIKDKAEEAKAKSRFGDASELEEDVVDDEDLGVDDSEIAEDIGEDELSEVEQEDFGESAVGEEGEGRTTSTAANRKKFDKHAQGTARDIEDENTALDGHKAARELAENRAELHDFEDEGEKEDFINAQMAQYANAVDEHRGPDVNPEEAQADAFRDMAGSMTDQEQAAVGGSGLLYGNNFDTVGNVTDHGQMGQFNTSAAKRAQMSDHTIGSEHNDDQAMTEGSSFVRAVEAAENEEYAEEMNYSVAGRSRVEEEEGQLQSMGTMTTDENGNQVLETEFDKTDADNYEELLGIETDEDGYAQNANVRTEDGKAVFGDANTAREKLAKATNENAKRSNQGFTTDKESSILMEEGKRQQNRGNRMKQARKSLINSGQISPETQPESRVFESGGARDVSGVTQTTQGATADDSVILGDADPTNDVESELGMSAVASSGADLADDFRVEDGDTGYSIRETDDGKIAIDTAADQEFIETLEQATEDVEGVDFLQDSQDTITNNGTITTLTADAESAAEVVDNITDEGEFVEAEDRTTSETLMGAKTARTGGSGAHSTIGPDNGVTSHDPNSSSSQVILTGAMDGDTVGQSIGVSATTDPSAASRVVEGGEDGGISGLVLEGEPEDEVVNVDPQAADVESGNVIDQVLEGTNPQTDTNIEGGRVNPFQLDQTNSGQIQLRSDTSEASKKRIEKFEDDERFEVQEETNMQGGTSKVLTLKDSVDEGAMAQVTKELTREGHSIGSDRDTSQRVLSAAQPTNAYYRDQAPDRKDNYENFVQSLGGESTTSGYHETSASVNRRFAAQQTGPIHRDTTGVVTKTDAETMTTQTENAGYAQRSVTVTDDSGSTTTTTTTSEDRAPTGRVQQERSFQDTVDTETVTRTEFVEDEDGETKVTTTVEVAEENAGKQPTKASQTQPQVEERKVTEATVKKKLKNASNQAAARANNTTIETRQENKTAVSDQETETVDTETIKMRNGEVIREEIEGDTDPVTMQYSEDIQQEVETVTRSTPLEATNVSDLAQDNIETLVEVIDNGGTASIDDLDTSSVSEEIHQLPDAKQQQVEESITRIVETTIQANIDRNRSPESTNRTSANEIATGGETKEVTHEVEQVMKQNYDSPFEGIEQSVDAFESGEGKVNKEVRTVVETVLKENGTENAAQRGKKAIEELQQRRQDDSQDLPTSEELQATLGIDLEGELDENGAGLVKAAQLLGQYGGDE